MAIAVAMRNDVTYISEDVQKTDTRGYATYSVDAATLSRLVELY